jgi:alcohol dehydrogenase YqhD (iron-dependent ADH family)
MKEFIYEMPVKVYFGENGVEKHLANELSKYGPNIMIAYGKGSVKRNRVYDAVVKVLKENGKKVIDLPDIPANPTYSKVIEGIQLYKDNNVDLVIALGGGSVVDCVKVITAGTEINEDLWVSQMDEGKIASKMGNYAVILTLSGSGAEMDCLGAILNEERQQKLTFVGSYAKFVILDPLYVMTAPLKVFMPGVYDTLSHCLETYFGKICNVSDSMNEGLMRDIIENMKELINGNDTLEIRSNCMWDSSLIQTFLFSCGKEGDFQAHRIENTLGAFSHGTHGKQLAVIQPTYYRYVYKDNPSKFARFAKNVMNVKDEGTDEEIALKGIEALEQLVKDAHLGTTFNELGYELTEEVAKKVSQTCVCIQTNQRPLTEEDIYQILMKCK